jgi:hypothetical protein
VRKYAFDQEVAQRGTTMRPNEAARAMIACEGASKHVPMDAQQQSSRDCSTLGCPLWDRVQSRGMSGQCRFLFCVFSLALIVGCGGDDDDESEFPDLTGGDNVGGFVEDDNGPVVGATVSVYGANPAVSTTTNGAGYFALEAIDIDPYILIEAPGHWGKLERVSLRPPEVGRGNYVFDVPEDGDVEEVAAALGRTQLDTNGIVIADFSGEDTLDGATATIDIVSDPSFAFDANGDPVESTSIIAGSEDTELIFSNAVVGDVDVVPGNMNTPLFCFRDFPFAEDRFPVLPRVISRLQIFCQYI